MSDTDYASLIRVEPNAYTMREEIADGIEQAQNDASTAVNTSENANNTANTANDRVNNIVANQGSAESTEVIDSRHDNINNTTYNNLGARLDASSLLLEENFNKVKDIAVNVKLYGAIGDGNSHKISDIFPSVTLSQVQAIDSTATLNDEADWYAIMKAINSTSIDCEILLANGIFCISKPIILNPNCSFAMANGAKILVTAAIDYALRTAKIVNQTWDKRIVDLYIECNDLAKEGLKVIDTQHLSILNGKIYNAIQKGYRLGDPAFNSSSSIGACETNMINCYYRRNANAQHTGEIGFYIDTITDNHLTMCRAIGADISFHSNNSTGGNHYIDCHGWGYPESMPSIIFEMQEQCPMFTNCSSDTPKTIGWDIYNDARLTNCRMMNNNYGVDNIITGINARSYAPVINIDGFECIGSSAARILNTFVGNLYNVKIIGMKNSYVTNVQNDFPNYRESHSSVNSSGVNYTKFATIKIPITANSFNTFFAIRVVANNNMNVGLSFADIIVRWNGWINSSNAHNVSNTMGTIGAKTYNLDISLLSAVAVTDSNYVYIDLYYKFNNVYDLVVSTFNNAMGYYYDSSNVYYQINNVKTLYYTNDNSAIVSSIESGISVTISAL